MSAASTVPLSPGFLNKRPELPPDRPKLVTAYQNRDSSLAHCLRSALAKSRPYMFAGVHCVIEQVGWWSGRKCPPARIGFTEHANMIGWCWDTDGTFEWNVVEF